MGDSFHTRQKQPFFILCSIILLSITALTLTAFRAVAQEPTSTPTFVPLGASTPTPFPTKQTDYPKIFSPAFAPADANSSDIFIQLKWNNLQDLDLHVIDPYNHEIAYYNKSVDGGTLDHDANPNCYPPLSSTSPEETVSWPLNTAPHGTYKVLVYTYNECGAGAITYNVSVKNGNVVSLYSGTSPQLGAGLTVTTFAFPPAPAATWPSNITPDSIVPSLTKAPDHSCTAQDRASDWGKSSASARPCAYAVLQDFQTAHPNATWKDLIAAIYDLEGRNIMVTQPAGTCWYRKTTTTGDTFPQGTCGTLQGQFTYAVVESLDNVCARRLGQWENATYKDYKGQCSEDGILDYLAGIQAWYNPPFTPAPTSNDTTQAGTELTKFSYNSSVTPTPPQTKNNPNWGVCPCKWGNVSSLSDAQQHSTYSYYIDPTNASLPYFKVYGAQ